MGTVTDLRAHRNARRQAATNGRFVVCAQCGERHPVIRLADGSLRCVTAFPDGEHWFCRNRGCRATYLARHSER